MTTLFIAKSKDGRPDRRCDASCYNAKGDKCCCVCGGKNHGVGFDQALEHLALRSSFFYARQSGYSIISIPIQLFLFNEEFK